MPVVYRIGNKETDLDLDVLKRNGYSPMHWGTVIECYRKGDDIVYHNTKTNEFFKPPKKTFKVIVAGGRDFDDYRMMKEKLDFILQNIKEPIEIVSGGQVSSKDGRKYGADYFGEMYAKAKNYALTRFPADWDNLGRKAGFVRNEQMAVYAKGGGAVCFWDGRSPGTKSMIALSKQYGLKLKVVNYDSENV